MSKQPSTEDFMILSKQNIEQQRIIESQAQQISLYQKQIQDLHSQNIRVNNQNDQLKLKSAEYKTMQKKIALLKEALTKDFNKLKQKMQETSIHNQQLQAQILQLKDSLKDKDIAIDNYCKIMAQSDRQLMRAHQHVKFYKQENQDLRSEITTMKIVNIQSRLNSLSKSRRYKQNMVYIPKNSSKKTVKKKLKSHINNSGSASKFATNISVL